MGKWYLKNLQNNITTKESNASFFTKKYVFFLKNTAHPTQVISKFDSKIPERTLFKTFDARDYVVRIKNMSWLNSTRRTYNSDKEKIVKFSVNGNLRTGDLRYIENTTYCEKIPYESIYTDTYILGEGRMPFILGFYNGATEFTSSYKVNYVGGLHIETNHNVRNYGVFKYIVPIFGMGEL